MDQAVLLPTYTIFLVCLKYKFRLKELSNLHKFILFIAAFAACGTDWYGWVSVTVIFFLAFVNEWILEDKSSFSYVSFLKQYLNSTKFMLLGILLAGVSFLIQILYYKDGITQLLKVFIYRSSAMEDASGTSITLITLLREIIDQWVRLLPQTLQRLFNKFVFTSLNDIDVRYFIAALVIVLLMLLFLASLYYVYKRSEDRKIIIYIYVLIFFIPLIQILFLKHHSFIHDFSASKMILPIAFSLLVLPIVTLVKIAENFLDNKHLDSSKYNLYASLFTVVLGLVIVVSSRGGLTDYASEANYANRELGFVVSRNIAPEELPITDPTSDLEQAPPSSLLIEPFPPEPLWYAKRFVYSSKQLKDLHLRANVQNLKRMKPVFLTYKDRLPKASVSSICQGQWLDLVGKVADHDVVACKSPKLRQLLD